MRRTQIPLFAPETEWVAPHELKDLTGHKEIATDLETCDPDLKSLGSGNVSGNGHIAGVAVAVEGWSGYYPIGHEGGGNMDNSLASPNTCLLYTSPSPRDRTRSRMPSSA